VRLSPAHSLGRVRENRLNLRPRETDLCAPIRRVHQPPGAAQRGDLQGCVSFSPVCRINQVLTLLRFVCRRREPRVRGFHAQSHPRAEGRPLTSRAHSNLPQAFTLLSLISTCYNVDRASQGRNVGLVE